MPQPSATSRGGSVREALRRLDPTSRALLDLSYRHRWRPEEIAKVLDVDAATVVELRDAALVRVAADVGLTADDERERATELLAGGSSNGAPPPVNAATRPRRRIAGALAGVSLLAVAVALVLTLGGSSKPTVHRAALRRPVQMPPAAPARVTLRRLAGAPAAARGNAALERGNLVLALSGLPRRGRRSFAVWLVGARGRHRALVHFPGGDARLMLALPPGFRGYRWVEVVRVGRRYAPHQKPVLAVTLRRLPPAT